MRSPTIALMTAVILFSPITNITAATDAASGIPAAQVIILKLDDVIQSKEEGGPVSPRWKRIADYIESNHLKASFGIIGASLDGGDADTHAYSERIIKEQPELVKDFPLQDADNPVYYHWIKEHRAKGFIEFWCHGYRMRIPSDTHGEFEQGTFEEQKAALEKCERLALEKLGFDLPVFGPHWSVTTPATGRALEAIPEIKIIFGGVVKDTKKFVLPTVMGLEISTGVPDFKKFKDKYEKIGFTKPYLHLQGHPDKWDDAKWDEFLKIINYLKSKHCVFMTPSEYVASVTSHQ